MNNQKQVLVKKNTKQDMVSLFIDAKRAKGCSEKSFCYYKTTIYNMLKFINKSEYQITIEDLRGYLDMYQRCNTANKETLDNIRHILSSYFAWLKSEGYIAENPVRSLNKNKIEKMVKCPICGIEFVRQHPNTRQVYCSYKCKMEAKRRQAREYSERKRIKRRQQTGNKIIYNGNLCKHSDCIYKAKTGTCDYAIINHKLRGCSADKCDKYESKRG